jgi:hypothetical protein
MNDMKPTLKTAPKSAPKKQKVKSVQNFLPKKGVKLSGADSKPKPVSMPVFCLGLNGPCQNGINRGDYCPLHESQRLGALTQPSMATFLMPTSNKSNSK